jgi:hypothetical protein
VAAVALCAALAACEPPVEPIAAPAPRIVVHAVLDLGSIDFQFVLLERTGGQGFPGIEGALVTVSTATGTVQATEDARSGVPTVYRFSRFDVPGGLNPGATYRLRVVTPDGDTVTGVTTVPNVPPVLAPVPFGAFNRLSDTLRLVWQRVPGARSYQVSVFSQTNTRTFSYSTFADTSIMIPGTARTFDGDPVFPAGARVVVVVAAVEDNYYTYFHAGVDPFAGAPSSRLTGALGVFGAVVPVIDRRYDVQ